MLPHLVRERMVIDSFGRQQYHKRIIPDSTRRSSPANDLWLATFARMDETRLTNLAASLRRARDGRSRARRGLAAKQSNPDVHHFDFRSQFALLGPGLTSNFRSLSRLYLNGMGTLVPGFRSFWSPSGLACVG